jgi:hypothetical protein
MKRMAVLSQLTELLDVVPEVLVAVVLEGRRVVGSSYRGATTAACRTGWLALWTKGSANCWSVGYQRWIPRHCFGTLKALVLGLRIRRRRRHHPRVAKARRVGRGRGDVRRRSRP